MSAADVHIPANVARGEAMIAGYRLRPSFAALVAAEGELGPLFALVERAADGRLTLAESAALFWHCIDPRPDNLVRADFADAVGAAGLAAMSGALRTLLGQILRGG
ncbi:MAG: gene transfer agent family protein [Sphingomonadaceae bacterium]|nr:gene transfer agent family protein [Sphingomonadaceae bacterium]